MNNDILRLKAPELLKCLKRVTKILDNKTDCCIEGHDIDDFTEARCATISAQQLISSIEKD